MKIVIDLWNQYAGDLEDLRRMIVSGWANGADAVKPQLFTSKLRRGDDARKYLEVTFDEIASIYKFTKKLGIEIYSTVFDEEKLEWIDELGTDVYKIASETIGNDPKLCEKILAKNKITYVSNGLKEIGAPDEFPFGHDSNIRYLFCVAEYPTYLYNARLRQMPKEFNEKGYYGFSDHALGFVPALEAYRRGAQILEKHYTHNILAQNVQEGAHLCSLEPETLRQFKKLCMEYKVFLGR